MQVSVSQGGARYPRSLGEFQSWFVTDADCLDYLEWLRWPDGFVCPRCDNVGGWRVLDGSFKCTGCKAGTAVTAGTLFELDAIAAAYVGGVSAAGGVGRVTGAVIGALVMASLTSGMNLMGIGISYQYIVRGIILALAVIFDVATRNR